ncbi:ipa protein [Fusarium austroafricanum]|uniref:Ipa protein n=1 Tax=Fusarium austroafricanum TaxID=2364996 RepID=A0A8H4K0D9_9HYPO|nr:ipa protein [Fusarium austroafricanum]
MMEYYSYSLQAQKLHAELARKYTTHFHTICTTWVFLTHGEREQCIKAASPGYILDLQPEWNLNDLAALGSSYLLELFKHRATKSLIEQYRRGMDGGPGDFKVIFFKKDWRKHVPCWDRPCFYFTEEMYGEKIEISSLCDSDVENKFNADFEAYALVSEFIGQQILFRQIALLRCLNTVVEAILERHRQHHLSSQPASKGPIRDSTVKLTLQDVIDRTRERELNFEVYLSLLREKPEILCEDVKHQYDSRPELTPLLHPGGSTGPMTTLGLNVFDVVHDKLGSLTIWKTIRGFLDLLKGPPKHEYYHSIIAHELHALCREEFYRKRRLFARHISTGIAFDWLRRSHDGFGSSSYHEKRKPGELIHKDPQLHYLLCLHREMHVLQAAEWLPKLGNMWKKHPSELERLSEREFQAFSELATIIAFVEDLSSVIMPPPCDPYQGLLFEDSWKELGREMAKIRSKEVRKLNFAESVDGTLQPYAARCILNSLDKWMRKKTRQRMGFPFEKASQMAFHKLEWEYEWKHVKRSGHAEKTAFLLERERHFSKLRNQLLLEHRAKTDKENAWHLHSVYSISPNRDRLQPNDQVHSSQIFKVNPTIAKSFAVIFEEALRAVPWQSFINAMASLGFSIVPRYGFAYVFTPPGSVMPLCIQRPQNKLIQGQTKLILARRLNRVYGLSAGSFEAD